MSAPPLKLRPRRAEPRSHVELPKVQRTKQRSWDSQNQWSCGRSFGRSWDQPAKGIPSQRARRGAGSAAEVAAAAAAATRACVELHHFLDVTVPRHHGRALLQSAPQLKGPDGADGDIKNLQHDSSKTETGECRESRRSKQYRRHARAAASWLHGIKGPPGVLSRPARAGSVLRSQPLRAGQSLMVVSECQGGSRCTRAKTAGWRRRTGRGLGGGT